MSQSDPQEALLDRARVVIRQLKQKLAEAEAGRPEPIAIIGMACRFPGKAINCDEFWSVIEAGEQTTVEVPPDRWDGAALYNPDPAASGKVATRYGSFLQNVDGFDAAFFDISPREAVHMDPQQRLFLEVAWHALEDAGQVREQLAESDTGVFVGIHSHSNDYFRLQSNDLAEIDTYTGPGTGQDVIAGRLAYWLDLRGPCAAINTACSSSLVAVHLARRSLLARDCRMAVVGGVNMLLSPASTVMISRLSMLSPDGRCKAFDSRADGFGRGEGCGAVVLKRLSDATADGDRILAVIRGSAVNQDGRSNGLTAPNGLAQQRVIRRALEDAGLDPAAVGYLEAHGTGTALGDPIEVEALTAVLGPAGADGPGCALGSVKANIGHLEGAAGIAGIIKSVLALRHRVVPPIAGWERLNPHISIEGSRLYIPTAAQPWPAARARRSAGVSSFGWSGTNSHIVLEEVDRELAKPSGNTGRAVIVPVSGATAEALRQAAGSYAGRFEKADPADLPDLAYTAATRRTHHEFRLAVAAASPKAIAEGFRQKAAQALTNQRLKSRPKIAFIYSGQGTPLASCRELFQEEAVFRQILESCADEVRKVAGWDLLAMMTEEGKSDWSTDYAQPAIFALEAAMTGLLASWGIRAEAVAGHSVGEIAAAWAGGVLTLKDATRLVVRRGSLMHQTSGMGATAAIAASKTVVQGWIDGEALGISIAAVNSPFATVVAGARTGVDALLQKAKANGIPAKQLSADYAFHTPLMAAAAANLASMARDLPVLEAALPIYSTVTGGPVARRDFSGEYWGRNILQPVLFYSAVEAMADQGFDTFVEIGPGSALTPMISECCSGRHPRVIPLLRRGATGRLSVLSAVADLYQAGVPVDWKPLAGKGTCVDLPGYPFQHKRYWVQTSTRDTAAETVAAPDDWFYELAWREKRFGNGGLRPVRADQVAIESQARLDRDVPLAASPVSLEKLESDAVQYMAEALRGLGFPFQPGDRFVPEELAKRLNVSEKHVPLFHKIVATLANHGFLRTMTGGFEATGLTPGPLPARHGEAGCVEAALLEKCGPRLAEVLRSQLNPLELLFGGEGANAEDLYRDSVTMRACNRLVRESFTQLLSNLSQGRDIHVLELGAGTGATTSALLEAGSAGIAEYTFTDVSRLLLTRAAEQFRGFPFMRYELFDLEHDVQSQGFQSGHYDVVIAANVLHATSELKKSLSIIRTLLAPGGVLLLLETTEPRSWIDLTFGLTEGWWRFTDRHTRDTDPLVSESRWIDLMRESGFDQAASCGVQNPGGNLIEENVFVAVNPATGENGPAKSDAGNWLVLADSEGFAEEFSKVVRAQNGHATLVDRSNDLPLAQWFDQARAYGRVNGIVHLRSLDHQTDSEPAAAAQQLAWESCRLFQELASTSGDGARIWFVTRGAQTLSGDLGPVALAQTSLWGLGRGAALEYPECWGGLIDLDPRHRQGSAQRLLQQLLAEGEEDEVAFRGGSRFVARFTRATAPPRSSLRIRRDATYMLTGAFGGIGLEIAQWLVRRGATHLVLIGRSTLNQTGPQLEVLRELGKLGATVRVERCDVGDYGSIAELFAKLQREGPSIRGIIHAAAAVHLKHLGELTGRDFESSFRAKVAGSWNLHRLSTQADLDFLVYFSSAAASMGARDRADYAAANEFMDALAHERSLRHLPATSIGWGAWEVVRAATGEQRESILRSGFDSMPAGMALDAMSRLASSGTPHRTVARIHWSALKSAFEVRGRRQFVSEIQTAAEQVGTIPSMDLPARIQAAPPARRAEILEEVLLQEVRRILGLDAGDAVDPLCGFFQLGMDSLMTVELKTRLEVQLGCTLPGTLTLNYPTVTALAEYLVQHITREQPASENAIVPPAPPVAEVKFDDIEGLSDEEVREALFAEMRAVRGDFQP